MEAGPACVYNPRPIHSLGEYPTAEYCIIRKISHGLGDLGDGWQPTQAAVGVDESLRGFREVPGVPSSNQLLSAAPS